MIIERIGKPDIEPRRGDMIPYPIQINIFIVFYFKSLTKIQVFFFKRFIMMMFFLV